MKHLSSRISRRQLLKAGLYAGAGMMLPWRFGSSVAKAVTQMAGLSDPAMQPKFANFAPNALAPSFKYASPNGKYKIAVRQTTQWTGLVDPGGRAVPTTVWGYGENGNGPGKGPTWPGRTFEVWKGQPVEVMWENKLIGSGKGRALPHLFPVDSSLHWCYSLPGYEQYSIADSDSGIPAGVPIVPHLHGGHTRFQFDGNPEYFFSPGWKVRGPRWMDKKYIYDNDQPAGTLWYHDHALGITRLNVYAGLAGFYIVRDDFDTGKPDNPLGLPAGPYELAYAIQDRMFWDNGELFYSGFPGDPFWSDFITDEGLSDSDVPQPSALAEFFGDHMVVNGVIWPKAEVEPRNYRMRLLNGCDSRFMVVQFRQVAAGATDLAGAGAPIPFHVIGSDQGLAGSAGETDTLVFEPGGRYDVVFDFSQVTPGSRIIMTNLGGDAPFGGDYGLALDADDLFGNRQTDRIMAFDVTLPLDANIPDTFEPSAIGSYAPNDNPVTRTRKVALFEGKDEYGRLQPLLGTAEPTLDAAGNTVNGSLAWHNPTTETPGEGDTEIWEIYNATGDAHPVHLHLVHFDVMDRREFTADTISQPILQHNGTFGNGFRLENISIGNPVATPTGYLENSPKDMVTALPGQVTRIKATFDKSGRYVWHCHILSHEDHEMMRVLEVIPKA